MRTVSARTDKRAGDSPDAELITLRAAMARYSVSYDLLHQAIHRGDLTALRPSREWLVEPGDVRALLERLTEERDPT